MVQYQDYQKKYYEQQIASNKRKRAAGSGQNKGQNYAKITAHEGKFRAERQLAEKEQKRKANVNKAVREMTSTTPSQIEPKSVDYKKIAETKLKKKKINKGRKMVDSIIKKGVIEYDRKERMNDNN